MAKRITSKQVGRPMDFVAFDGETYNGRITEVKRAGIRFFYHVNGEPFDGCLSHEIAAQRVVVY